MPSPSDLGHRAQGASEDLAKQVAAAQQALKPLYDGGGSHPIINLTLPCELSPETVATYLRNEPRASHRVATLTLYDKAGTPTAFQWLPGEKFCV